MTEPSHVNQRRDKSSSRSWLIHGAIVIGLASAFIALFKNPFQSSSSPRLDTYGLGTESGICQQVPKLSPRNTQVEQYIREKVDSVEYHREIINKLSGIIQIPA